MSEQHVLYNVQDSLMKEISMKQNIQAQKFVMLGLWTLAARKYVLDRFALLFRCSDIYQSVVRVRREI